MQTNVMWFFLGLVTGVAVFCFALQRKLSRRTRVTGILLVLIVLLLAYWGYQYDSHSTPEKAQATSNPTVGPLESIPFAQGVVLITPSGDGDSFTAWYMTKTVWGWRNEMNSEATYGLDPQNYNVDFESFAIDGETFVWGTSMTRIKEIDYRHKGKIYRCRVGKHPVWHMSLPFTQTFFLHSEWSMVLPNGKTAPLFK